jgi:hypothetical protein
MGTAIFLSILFTNAGTNIAENLKNAGVSAAAAGKVDLNNTSGLSSLPDNIRHPILVGFSDAMDVVFLVGACVLVAAIVLAALMKEVPLRTQSGMQAAREHAAATDATMPDAGGATHAPEEIAPASAGGAARKSP